MSKNVILNTFPKRNVLLITCYLLLSHTYSLLPKLFLQLRNGDLAIVEDTGGEGSIGTTLAKDMGYVGCTACSTRSDDGYAEVGSKARKGGAGIAFARAVVVHRGEENFTSTTLLCLVRPLEEFTLRGLRSAMRTHGPMCLRLIDTVGKGLVTRIDCHYDKLRTIARGYLID